jgi:hypothetical protein
MPTPEQALLRRRLQTLRESTSSHAAAAELIKQEKDWLANFIASINRMIRQTR